MFLPLPKNHAPAVLNERAFQPVYDRVPLLYPVYVEGVVAMELIPRPHIDRLARHSNVLPNTRRTINPNLIPIREYGSRLFSHLKGMSATVCSKIKIVIRRVVVPGSFLFLVIKEVT
jgi:hypothetical protein